MSNSVLEPAAPAGALPSAKRGLFRRTAAVLLTGLMLGVLLVTTGGTAQAADPATHQVATWNMQVGSDRWQGAAVMAGQNSVLALQEVPNTQPASSTYLGTNGNIDEYYWDVGGGNFRHLYVLRTGSRDVGIATSFLPDAVGEVPGPYRSALAVANGADDVVFASIHAASPGGGDVPALLQNVANDANGRGLNHWAVLGDFNRDPGSLNPGQLPVGGAYIYNTGLATHQGGGELDYMVSNVNTQDWQGSRGVNRGSDHWPVFFGSLRAAAGPRELTIHANISDLLLDVVDGRDDNGTHVITYHENGGANQRFRMQPSGYTNGEGDIVYRIVGVDSGKCIDVDKGLGSHRGDFLNIWTCHGTEGEPNPAPADDTQYFTLEHPVANMPNLTMLRDFGTDLFANIDHNGTEDGTLVVQWPWQAQPPAQPPRNEVFYLHPVVE